VKPEVVGDRHFLNSRIAIADFGFDCSRHYKDIVRLGRYRVRRGRQLRGGVGQLRNVHKGWPSIVSGGMSKYSGDLPISAAYNRRGLEH
jgi:hypothetical protein